PRRQWDRSGGRGGRREKAKRSLGFESEASLEEGLQRTIDWTRRNLPLIETCIGQHSAHMTRSKVGAKAPISTRSRRFLNTLRRGDALTPCPPTPRDIYTRVRQTPRY